MYQNAVENKINSIINRFTVASLEQMAFLNPLQTVSKQLRESKHTYLKMLKL